ncbi:hypothetical protein BFP97_01625 [Roseivirga sp. 4D4]|uniref:hypothetical protein n=1 Tax=Roseivirga sp. 4D4 TaxID=1889784 RepID=UPI0008535311|nr:hypothetical protein [Roseivirga sp. 4D4]OEK00289.1 hypothetical protein BFP97_01625 [Roseivirga sp. 4D4]
MALKESLEENKQFILDSLPTQELKDEFLASLDKVEEPTAPSVDEQIAEAQAPDHVSEELYEAVKKELAAVKPIPKMTEEEEKAAIEESLKHVPTEPNEGE